MEKKFYEPHVYKSVDDRSLSKVISQKTTVNRIQTVLIG